MRIGVVGCGYVGGVSAACFAELGHTVDCFDIDSERMAAYEAGRTPFFEPGLDELLRRGLDSGRLRFRSSYPPEIESEVIFIAVNTPGSSEGAADLRAVRDACTTFAPLLRPGAIVVNKSTVPIGTGELVEGMVRRAGGRDVRVVSNPEFLREGSAIHDFMQPDRIVLGSRDEQAIDRVAMLYDALNAPVVRVDIRTAEMIKYASNAFLATKVSFINEMAAICEALGADVEDVARGMGLDSRIGPRFLNAGLGWGGSCFPKDVRALVHMASVHGTQPQMLRSVLEINTHQRHRMVARMRSVLGTLEGRVILVLGAAFKPFTDDIRNAPSLELAGLLASEGADVRLCDPVVQPGRVAHERPGITMVDGVQAGAAGTHAIVLATEWPEYASFDFSVVRPLVARAAFFDARIAASPALLAAAGFEYYCVGRPSHEHKRIEERDSSAMVPVS